MTGSGPLISRGTRPRCYMLVSSRAPTSRQGGRGDNGVFRSVPAAVNWSRRQGDSRLQDGVRSTPDARSVSGRMITRRHPGVAAAIPRT
jgi:hypothetical protein